MGIAKATQKGAFRALEKLTNQEQYFPWNGLSTLPPRFRNTRGDVGESLRRVEARKQHEKSCRKVRKVIGEHEVKDLLKASQTKGSASRYLSLVPARRRHL